MTGYDLRMALHSGRRTYGTLIVSPSPRWPPVVKQTGVDFVFIDTEHIALDRAQLSWMCRAYDALGIAPLVRIGSPDPYEATKALDGGAAGIIAPYVENADQVQALRGAVKYRPLKGMRLNALLKGEPCEPGLAAYIRQSCLNNMLIVNIESTPAIEALDSILRVPDLDAVLVGPHDLSCSLGVPEQYGHKRFLEAVRTIFRKARAAGIGAGIHFWGDLDIEASFVRDGANLLIHSSDIELFAKHLSEELGSIRRAVGQTPPAPLHSSQTINL